MPNRDSALKILELLLKNVIPYEDQDHLLGDFEEMHDRISSQYGKTIAMAWYIFQVFKLIPSYFRNYIYWSVTMFKNYLKVA